MLKLRQKLTMRGIFTDLRPGDSSVLTLEGRSEPCITFRRPPDDEAHSNLLECDIEASFRPKRGVLSAFKSLSEGILPDGTSPDLGKFGEHIGPDGSFDMSRVPPLSILPDDLRAFIRSASGQLRDAISRATGLLIWRDGLEAPANPFSSRGSEWTLDGVTWHPLPADLYGNLRMLHPGLLRGEEALARFRAMWDSGAAEPEAHHVLREARSVLSGNLRSALVIGVAATEIGTKAFVIKRASETEWLVSNAPTPPLVEMIRNYLPKLPVVFNFNGRVLWWDGLLETLGKAVQKRNKVAHVGGISLSYRYVADLLDTIRDYLYLLDYYDGAEWAFHRLRLETQWALRPELREQSWDRVGTD